MTRSPLFDGKALARSAGRERAIGRRRRGAVVEDAAGEKLARTTSVPLLVPGAVLLAVSYWLHFAGAGVEC